MKLRTILKPLLAFSATALLVLLLTSHKVLEKQGRPAYKYNEYPLSVKGETHPMVRLDRPAAPGYPDLAASSDPSLRKLAEYRAVAGNAAIDRMLLFTELPPSVQAAPADAADLAGRLTEFARFSVRPVVILEPTVRGRPVDGKAYRAGRYDAILDAYFSALKSSGVSDAAMGLWVPFPEGNTPRWHDTDPADFSANVAKTIGFQKKYFPGSRAAILLDSKTYPSDDDDWAHGVYASLTPYVEGLPKGLVDSVGLQAFPWTPPRGDTSPPIVSAPAFLRVDLAEDLARRLGVVDIWLNTGTFARYYTDDPGGTVAFSLPERAGILGGIAVTARRVRADGFSVAVNLFSADKSNQDEHVDWSYWHDLSPRSAAGQELFRTFAQEMYDSGIGIWVFDE